MVVNFKYNGKEIIKVIIVYGPAENERPVEKDDFWAKLQEVNKEG